jgi:tRNA threonylcarbamoyladenosine dehydratase
LSLDVADFQRRFGGLERLYGVGGAASIYSAHVAVVGIGGVGSWAAEALARSGVGRLTLIDLDHVAESNINRQIQAHSSTVGQAKVQAMQARIAQINPACQVQGIEEFVEPGNWPQILPSGVSAVLDACDQVKAKLAMAAWARTSRGALFVSCGAAGGKRAAHKVEVADLAETTHDPLLAQLRYRLRKQGAPAKGKMGVACVFSREAVAPPDPSCAVQEGGDGSLNCHGYGSSVSVTATFGLCAAGYLMDELARRASRP